MTLRLAGHDVAGYAELLSDEGDVAEHLGVNLRQIPMSARALGIRVENGRPDPAGLANAARDWLLVRISLGEPDANAETYPLN